MGFWSTVGSLFGIDDSGSVSGSGSGFSSTDFHEDMAVNPATGLPMVGGTGGVDVHGNPYGSDMNEHHHSFNDSFSSIDSFSSSDSVSSSFDDSSSWDSSSSFSSSDW